VNDFRAPHILPPAAPTAMSWIETNGFVTADDFARRLGVSRHTVYRAVAAGRLRTVRLNSRGKILIPQKELRRLLGEHDREAALEEEL
jgi:excisionase family DNA binding protein